MTGYTVHTGSSLKFSSGWDAVFEGAKAAKKSATSESTPAVKAKKKAAKKSAAEIVKKSATKISKPKSSKAAKKNAAKRSQ